MKIKANENGSVIIVEAEGKKVIIGQTPFGTMCTDGSHESVEFEPIFENLSEDLIIREFGVEKAEFIGTCLGIVMSQIQAQIEEMDDTIDVDGEEVERYYLEE